MHQNALYRMPVDVIELRHRPMKKTMMILSLFAITILTESVEGFVPSSPILPKKVASWRQEEPRFLLDDWVCHHHGVCVASLRASMDDMNDDSSERVESPLGVRRRVKAVLKRAKNRTGINNNSELPTTTRQQQQGGGRRRQQESAITKSLYNTVAGIQELDDALVVPPPVSNGYKTPITNGTPGTSKKPTNIDSNSAAVNNKEADETSTPGEAINGAPKAEEEEEVIVRPAIKPLPFELPQLSPEQQARLLAGERIQEQSEMGREGSGYVVVDVKAPPSVVWECLLDFESYPSTIPTVRGVSLFTSENLTSGYHAEKPIIPGSDRKLRHYGTPSTTRAAFVLSKFRLNIAAIHKYRPHPDGHYMLFTLDPECTNVVLQNATGIWHTQSNPEGRGPVRLETVNSFVVLVLVVTLTCCSVFNIQEYTRVWLLCGLKVSPVLPRFIVDYAARRAMPRATTWLKPQVETAAQLWLKNTMPDATTQ